MSAEKLAPCPLCGSEMPPDGKCNCERIDHRLLSALKSETDLSLRLDAKNTELKNAIFCLKIENDRLRAERDAAAEFGYNLRKYGAKWNGIETKDDETYAEAKAAEAKAKEQPKSFGDYLSLSDDDKIKLAKEQGK